MSLELPSYIQQNIDRFSGRTWLLPKVLEWLEYGDKRIFLLTGGPGTGKSMILAWLAGNGPAPDDPAAAEQLARLRGKVTAVHFCMAASRSNSPLAFADNIASQLTRNVEGFGDALLATMPGRVEIHPTQTVGTVQSGGTVTGVYVARIDLGALGDEQGFDLAFTRPLKKLYASGYDRPLLLLVDALDEAETYTGVKLSQLLAGLEDLPNQVRLLATTRPDPRIAKYYRRSRPFDLIKDAPPDVDDVRAYALGRLAGVEGLDAGTTGAFAGRIARAARGIFLYAAMVLDELLPSLPSLANLDLARYPLPEGLSGLYHDFLNRELGQDEDRWYESFKPLLGLIAVGQGEGLSRTQLAAISGKEVEQPLRICKQYLSGELPEGPFGVFHRSFADFLLEDECNEDYHIDASTMHRQIADHYWRAHAPDWQGCDDYGLQTLVRHLLMAGDRERLEALICKEWSEARRCNGFWQDMRLVWPDPGALTDHLRQAAQEDPQWQAASVILAAELLQEAMKQLREKAPKLLDAGTPSARLAEASAANARVDPSDPGVSDAEMLNMLGFNNRSLAQISQARDDQASCAQYDERAAQAFKRSLDLDPENAVGYVGLGYVEYGSGNLDAASAAFRQAVELEPTYAVAYHDLALSYEAKMMRDDPTGADEWCRQALQAWQEFCRLAQDDPAFSTDYILRIGQRISRLEQRCGKGDA